MILTKSVHVFSLNCIVSVVDTCSILKVYKEDFVLTQNQIAYQNMLINAAKQRSEEDLNKAKAKSELARSLAQSELFKQQKLTEEQKTLLSALQYLKEDEIYGTEAERKYFSAATTAEEFWNFLPKFLGTLKLGGR